MEHDLTDEQLDILQDYFGDKYTESDDVDKEEARFERWVNGLEMDQIEKILAKKKVCHQCQKCKVENTVVLGCADEDCSCHSFNS